MLSSSILSRLSLLVLLCLGLACSGEQQQGTPPLSPSGSGSGAVQAQGNSPVATESGRQTNSGGKAGARADSARLALDEDGQAINKPMDGPGVIRGHLTVQKSFDQPWTLRVKVLPDRDGKIGPGARDVPMAAGQREFRVEGLALQRYSVRALAPGWNGDAQSLQLEAGAENIYSILSLTLGGTIEGRVLYGSGRPVANLAVLIRNDVDESQHETRTDSAGRFRFGPVLDGSWSLIFVSEEIVPLPARSLNFKAPRMSLPDTILSNVSDLVITVVDGAGNPVPNAVVTGVGNLGGVIDHMTDRDGQVRLRFYPIGTYRIRSVHPELGDGYVNLELLENAVGECRITLK